MWLAPFNIPQASRLWGIAVSPDGSRLAVADAGNDVVDVLNPDSPSAVSVFTLPSTGLDATAIPSGVAITDSGIVYYASFSVSIYGVVGLHKLDTSTGTVTDYTNFMVSGLVADAAMRLLLTRSHFKTLYKGLNLR
jgi:DNA-binding beta-propeller fold protein YncE